MDPIKYNYLLSLWDDISGQITHKTLPETNEIVELSKEEQQKLRQQIMVDKLKKSFGCT